MNVEEGRPGDQYFPAENQFTRYINNIETPRSHSYISHQNTILIEHLQVVSVLKILIICKFLNFTPFFTKKLNFLKFACNFPCKKVNFGLSHPTHITIHSF